MFGSLAGYAKSQLHRMKPGEYRGYMGARRKKMVDEFGYDVKNAAHCVRLLLMGIELAKDSTMFAYRPDPERATIMSIKQGNWSLPQVMAYSDVLTAEFLSLAADQTQLHAEPNYKKINELLIDIIREVGADG